MINIPGDKHTTLKISAIIGIYLVFSILALRKFYERRMEHFRDKEEMKKESHMIKQYSYQHVKSLKTSDEG